jgi:hypothetical protein
MNRYYLSSFESMRKYSFSERRVYNIWYRARKFVRTVVSDLYRLYFWVKSRFVFKTTNCLVYLERVCRREINWLTRWTKQVFVKTSRIKSSTATNLRLDVCRYAGEVGVEPLRNSRVSAQNRAVRIPKSKGTSLFSSLCLVSHLWSSIAFLNCP